VFTGEEPLDRISQDKINDAIRWMKEAGSRITIINASDLAFDKLMADIRVRVMRDGIKQVVIDYLQLVDLSALDKSREQQIAKGISALYRLAQSLKFNLIVLSQLNDDGKLRESRSPGFDTDVLIVIKKVTKPDGTSDESRRNLFIEKNRGGPRYGIVPCIFQGCYSRFGEMDQRFYEEEQKSTPKASGVARKFR